MPAQTVEVLGLRELEQAFDELEKVATRKGAARRALKAAGEPILVMARSLAPDDPRTSAPLDLTDSLAMSSRQKSGRATKYRKESKGEVVIHIGPTKEGYPQAWMQEFGTVHHAAVGYMRRSWDAEGGVKAVKRIASTLGPEIEKSAARQARRKAKLAK